jgi:hypothetical protein
MGYWKREYTERKGGKPLFRPEPKDGEEEVIPPEPPTDDQTRPERFDSTRTTPLPTPAGPPP